MLLWSTVATAFKLGLVHLTPAQLLWLSSCFALVIFAGAYVFRPSKPHIPKGAIWVLLLGVVNPFLYYLVLLEGYDRLPAQVAQPLNYLWAIVYALLAVPILRQRLTWTAVVGIVISYFGVVLLLTRGDWTAFDTFDAIGLTLILASTVLWAVYWLFQQRLSVPPVQFMFIGFAIGTPLIGIYCHWTDGLPDLSLTNLGYGAWIGCFEMGLTYLLWQRALSFSRDGASVSQLIFLSPLISLGLIQFILGEEVHVFTLLALPVILVGIYLVRRSVAN